MYENQLADQVLSIDEQCVIAMRKAYKTARRHKMVHWLLIFLVIGQSIYIGLV